MKNWSIQFMKWVKELCPWDKTEDYIHILSEVDNPMYQPHRIRINFFTHDYKYYLVAKENYLGCQVSCRKPRAGETWTRGNDLPDGKFSRETWEKIKNAVIRYELVKVMKPQEPIADTPK